MDTDGETDGDVPRLLRKKAKPIKVDEHTNFKKLKWQIEMTFRTVQGFKDEISRFAITQGYDLKIDISDSRRRRVGAVCKQGCKFKMYASWDKSKESTHGNPPLQKRQQGRPRKQHELLSEPREQGAAATRGREGSRGRRGRGRSVSSGPQSMTNQGQSLISSQASVATSSSQPFVSPP
ncbi:hypothetical protein Cgig2_005779 [Carnegiea gigantea]|uniref:Transposase MuDR plant domain-containing protein n=1 Tax=Carnegiea gigantea TaxID=171969 RepID=A0A9Q1QAQ8_9CARY|nr:hypothetical protein Cgig2_005779 [Carnegiea gigantea]